MTGIRTVEAELRFERCLLLLMISRGFLKVRASFEVDGGGLNGKENEGSGDEAAEGRRRRAGDWELGPRGCRKGNSSRSELPGYRRGEPIVGVIREPRFLVLDRSDPSKDRCWTLGGKERSELASDPLLRSPFRKGHHIFFSRKKNKAGWCSAVGICFPFFQA